jgi:ribose transport system permease protein
MTDKSNGTNGPTTQSESGGDLHRVTLRSVLSNQAVSLLLILFGIWIVLGILSPYFFTVSNLFEITLQAAVIAIIAAGETFVIVSGGIDLSVGSVFACAAVVGGMLLDSTGSLFVALVGTLSFGALLGLVNGGLITRLRVPPFIATLGMMGIARGFALILSNGIPIYGLDERYRWIGQGRIANVIPVPTVIVLLVFVVGYLIFNYTRFGRFVYAMGSNPEAARLSGINIRTMQLWIFTGGGFLAGLASIVEAARLGTIQPAGGQGYELIAIGAVVIGGTSLLGGEGHIFATLVGAVIMTTIRNGLNILGVNAFWQLVVNGSVIIAAVAIDQFRRQK